MNCANARDLIPDLAFGALNSNSQEELRHHLSYCRACAKEFNTLSATLSALDAMPTPKPSARLRQATYAAIAAEKRAMAAAATPAAPAPVKSSRRSLLFWIFQPVAACALVAVGYVAGHQHAAAPVPAAPAVAVADPSTQQQIKELQAKVDTMTQMVGYSLTKSSTNDRIAKVLTTAATVKPDEQVIDTLITTMSLDPSANVRLNAVEALYAHADNAVVKAAVVASLTHETCPIVQIALVDFAVGARDHDAIPELQKLIAADQTDPNVRDAAKNAIPQL